ncbi:ABC transporter permease [Sulfurovum riftiae]|uniref:ABC transporter n=1 Tax=Sulfurovum riftiae TaxID=1630136 RepID=A0A151CGW9_9BACT|nr:ABC transporter permease [Sulfurovum riftiae]KYJ86739.1 ABC transporter [Sulfurovum riftiae]
MRIFLTIVAKELISFLRSWGLLAVVLYSFTLDVYIAGAGMQIKPRNVAIGYVDETGGGVSQKILTRLHGPEFVAPQRFLSQQALSDAIFNKKILVGIVFDEAFEKHYREGKEAVMNVLLDATAASQSFTTLGYLQNIVMDFNSVDFPVALKAHKLFNENADNHTFMALSEMLSVITMLSILLPAMVFVKEKEEGTWDIMMLMPIDPRLTILAKSFSQVIIVLLGTIICVGFVLFGSFNMPMNGSFWAFFLLTFFYIFTSAGIGLFVAAVSKSILQVAQLSMIIMMPLIFLSGAWTPIHAMHPVLEKLSLISPLRYYIEGCESIFYRGTAFADLWPYFAGVLLLGSVLYWYGFRKIGKLF